MPILFRPSHKTFSNTIESGIIVNSMDHFFPNTTVIVQIMVASVLTSIITQIQPKCKCEGTCFKDRTEELFDSRLCSSYVIMRHEPHDSSNKNVCVINVVRAPVVVVNNGSPKKQTCKIA